jgi:3-deoxy-D-manno-octulosonic-acid transferase/heptosyltransferase-1
MMAPVMTNILIVKLSAIGDVVQTLPALEAIKRTYPASRIDWVVEEASSGILEGHPLIDRVLVSRRKAWFRMLVRPAKFLAGIHGIAGFLRDLRSVRYDIAIDFQGLLKSGIIIGLSRSVRKIGFDRTRELSYLFLNERLPAYDIEKHALERYLDVARYLGAVDPPSTCALPIERERATIRDRLSEAVIGGGRVVVINPLARWRTKLWTEEKFAQLADRLIAERNATVIFTGGPDDRDAVARILSMMRERALDWTGKTTLKELAALAERADLFITTDTGPMHLAAAAGGRVVALFGATAPWRTGPYGKGHVVVRAGLDCSPCFSRTCGRKMQCMEAITVDDVLAKVSA